MVKNLKGLFAIAMIFVFTIALTGCGNGKEKTNNSEKQTVGTRIADISKTNWEEVLEANFLLDISLPSGWTVEKAESLNNYSNINIVFIPSGETTFADFGETIFLKSKDVSTKQAPSVDSFQNSILFAGTSTWRYYPEIKNSVYVQVSIYDHSDKIEILINR